MVKWSSHQFFGLSKDQKIEFNEASLVIQRALRVYQAKKSAKEAFKRRFIKLYDALNDEYVYKDKQTDYIHPSKPFILGDEDLQSPRILVAPDDYDPGYDDVHKDGHAIIITVNSFVYNDKIPDLPTETTNEHEILKDILSHDYVCKFLPERVTNLINPTCAQFTAAFQHLQKVCKTSDFLLVYICTHIITAYKGEKNRSENGYLLMHESKWKSSKDVASTSISISMLGSLLNNILSKEKTVLLNCAHIDKPPSNIFGSKVLYPPSNCFERISDLANCAVIGNCSIGSLVSDVINHTLLPIQHEQPTTRTSFEEVLCNKENDHENNNTLLPSTSNIINNLNSDNLKMIVSPSKVTFIDRMKSILPRYNQQKASISNTTALLSGSSLNRVKALTDKVDNDRTYINKTKIKKILIDEVNFVPELTPAIRADIFSKYVKGSV